MNILYSRYFLMFFSIIKWDAFSGGNVLYQIEKKKCLVTFGQTAGKCQIQCSMRVVKISSTLSWNKIKV